MRATDRLLAWGFSQDDIASMEAFSPLDSVIEALWTYQNLWNPHLELNKLHTDLTLEHIKRVVSQKNGERGLEELISVLTRKDAEGNSISLSDIHKNLILEDIINVLSHPNGFNNLLMFLHVLLSKKKIQLPLKSIIAIVSHENGYKNLNALINMFGKEFSLTVPLEKIGCILTPENAVKIVCFNTGYKNIQVLMSKLKHKNCPLLTNKDIMKKYFVEIFSHEDSYKFWSQYQDSFCNQPSISRSTSMQKTPLQLLSLETSSDDTTLTGFSPKEKAIMLEWINNDNKSDIPEFLKNSDTELLVTSPAIFDEPLSPSSNIKEMKKNSRNRVDKRKFSDFFSSNSKAPQTNPKSKTLKTRDFKR